MTQKASVSFDAFLLSLTLTLSLAACTQSSMSFHEATGIDFATAHIALAEYGESDGTGNYSTLSISEESLNEILSSVRLEHGKKQDAMPNQFFFFHITLPDKETVELVFGDDGEIIVGNPDSRNFWKNADKTAFQQLMEYVSK